jgi:hypothetical protein
MPEKETATNVRTGETVVSEVPTADEAYIASLQARAGRVRHARPKGQGGGGGRRAEAAGARQAEDHVQSAPQETAVESKPRSTAGRGKPG